MSSGDVGHFDDAGRLFVDGRDDDMIVSGGENVFPVGGRGAAARPTRRRGGGRDRRRRREFGQRLRGVRRPQPRRDADRRRRPGVRASDNLARYKVPRDVVFLDELPRNPTGKVLKRELAGLG